MLIRLKHGLHYGANTGSLKMNCRKVQDYNLVHLAPQIPTVHPNI